MKIGDKVYQVEPSPIGGMMVMLSVKVWGITMAQEEITPKHARELAQLLQAAADQAEARG